MKRLFELSQISKPTNYVPKIPYKFAAIIGQIAKSDDRAKEIISTIYDDVDTDASLDRVKLAKIWVDKYVPEERIILNERPSIKLSDDEKIFLEYVIKSISKSDDVKTLEQNIYESVKKSTLSSKEAFSLMYKVLILRERGPRLAPFIFTIGKQKAADIFEKAIKY